MLFTTVLVTLVAVAAAAKDKSKRTFAVLRHYGDGPLMDCRMDPIVQPGGPSAHVHTFMGANNIGFNTTGEDLRKSTCTTALPKADLSAYWFPRLYFKDPAGGKLEPVKFFYMNVYYFFDATNDDIKSFPLGLQIVSGSAMLRTPPVKSGSQNLDPSKGVLSPAQITCPRGNFDPPSWPAGSDGSVAGIGDPNNKGSGIGFPFQDCDGYASPMRVDVHFPSCYNPAAGLTNFKANMAFPSDVGNGKLDCPKGWIHVPHMFFETYWDTHALLSRFQGTLGKSSPFVFANGDATGFSAHGDFISGWDEQALQQIIDNCDAGHAGIHQCPGLIGGVNDESKRCHATCPVDEPVNGKLDNLPGNNPLAGWQYGTGSGSGAGGGNTNPAPPAPAPPAPSSTKSPSTTGAAPSSSKAAYSPPAPVSSSKDALSVPSAIPTTFVPVVKASSSSSSPSSSVTAVPATTKVDPITGKTTTIYNTVTVWRTTTVEGSGSAPTQTSAPTSGTKDIGDFKYAGCYKDASDRFLAGEIRPNLGKISNTNCVTYCTSKGWTAAGTEYGGQCYCGKGLTTVEKLPESQCSMACEGAAGETCGGGWALSLYTKGGVAPSSPAKRHVHDHLMHHRRGHSHGW
ncbi:hypothetical protein B0T25DRAFT_154843 [Lasiosphaeria hispida]|uniref:WSC domain-containing protein n=1 Tax=Lasiosphaeria hispida TaxID=260671 RepID=A0AAJ0HLY2_9PEZI|nr:hypothetical protein B0T25DRAFT_154843 [Lasiosphaeria hispida]